MTGSLGFVPVDSPSRCTYLAGVVGKKALDLEQFCARQGAARDKANETKKDQNAIENRETHSKKKDT
jgi:hypothetical protein